MTCFLMIYWQECLCTHLYRDKQGPAVNSLWHNNVILWHRHGSTLVRVMDCRLMGRSHNLHKYWLLISVFLWHSPEYNFIVSVQTTICTMCLNVILFKLLSHLPESNDVNITMNKIKPAQNDVIRRIALGNYNCVEKTRSSVPGNPKGEVHP